MVPICPVPISRSRTVFVFATAGSWPRRNRGATRVQLASGLISVYYCWSWASPAAANASQLGQEVGALPPVSRARDATETSWG